MTEWANEYVVPLVGVALISTVLALLSVWLNVDFNRLLLGFLFYTVLRESWHNWRKENE